MNSSLPCSTSSYWLYQGDCPSFSPHLGRHEQFPRLCQESRHTHGLLGHPLFCRCGGTYQHYHEEHHCHWSGSPGRSVWPRPLSLTSCHCYSFFLPHHLHFLLRTRGSLFPPAQPCPHLRNSFSLVMRAWFGAFLSISAKNIYCYISIFPLASSAQAYGAL